MPPLDPDPTPGELSRRMGQVLTQFESLVRQVQELYVRKDILDLYRQSVDQALKALQDIFIADRSSIASRFENHKTDFASRVAETKSELDKKIGALDTDKVEKTEFNALKTRVDQLEDSNKWLTRLILTFVVTGILGAVFLAGGGLGR